jgi:hypothetical protein
VSRRLLSGLLVALAALALALSLLTGYAKHNLFNSDQFANRAAASLKDDAVSEQLATRITDDLVLRQDPDLIGFRPLIESATAGILRSNAFGGLFRAAAADVHRALFKGDRNIVFFRLADVGTLVDAAVKAVDPNAAKKISGRENAVVLKIEPPAWFTDLVQKAEDLSWLPWGLLALAIVLGGAGIATAPDRRLACRNAGIAVAVLGIAGVLAYDVVRSDVVGSISDPDQRAAASGIWDAFFLDLQNSLLLFAAAGAVFAAAAASLIRPIELGAPLGDAWALVSRVPESKRWRVLRALLLIATGVVVIAARDRVIQLLLLAVGAYLIYAGIGEILRLTTAARPDAEIHRGRRRFLLVAVASGLVLALVGGGTTAYVAAGGFSQSGEKVGTCNGHQALCDRPLNDVALAATHNSMSAASEPGWLFANQQKGIGPQLDSGIHGLLWDTHYGERTPDGTVKTDLGKFTSEERQAYVDEIGEQAVDAALRIRNRLVAGTGKRGIYLCHRFCELGSTSLSQGLAAVRDYLVSNPGEVMVIVNEDYVKPKDYTDAVKKAGLADLVYKEEPGPWPTLREMIDSGQRLVLLAEMHGGGEPWYHAAYEGILQETPYRFKQAAELTDPKLVPASCQPNRGGRNGSLFLLNNWIDTSPAPRPSNAEKVNAYGPLLHRAQTCRKIRGLLPNLVAIDFYESGDVEKVIDKLNGFGTVTEPEK